MVVMLGEQTLMYYQRPTEWCWRSPGRFFAANEIKAIFAHILLNYDVQFENGSMDRPDNIYLGALTIPNTKAKVMFRKRRT